MIRLEHERQMTIQIRAQIGWTVEERTTLKAASGDVFGLFACSRSNVLSPVGRAYGALEAVLTTWQAHRASCNRFLVAWKDLRLG